MSDAPTDIEAEIDALFAAELGDFISIRNDLAKRLAKDGDPEAAARIKALAKPSLSAWANNRLWWMERDAFEALVEAGMQVRDAQHRGAAPADLAEATSSRRKAIARLIKLGEAVLRDAGHATSKGTMRRITTTLEALAAYGDQAPAPGFGRYSQDLDPPGFDVLASLGPPSPRSRPNRPSTPNPSTSKKPAPQPAAPQLRRGRAKLQTALGRLEDAKAELDQAERDVVDGEREAERARTTAERAVEDHRSLLRQAREAERLVARAEQAASSAEKSAAKARAKAERAGEAVTRARSKVDEARMALEKL